jgi:hypothetical protein
VSESAFLACAGIATSMWLTVYALMIRRGLKDKSYGMPVIALCMNLAWEFYFAFLAGLPPVGSVGNTLYFLLDLGILATCLRYGRDDFDWPIFKAHFYKFVGAMLAVSFVLVAVFVRAFNDYGILSTMQVEMLYSTLLIAMIIRRNSVKGQSFYIALLILGGDILGNAAALYTRTHFQPDVPLVWVYTCLAYIVIANFIYLLLYVRIARRDGVSLWKRL